MIVDVALPLPLQKTFSYRVPAPWETFARLLVRVKVPLGNRTLVGFVVAVTEGDEQGLKDILDILDIFPLIGRATFELCAWASAYYLAPIGVALKYTVPSGLKVERYLSLKAKADAVRHLDGLTLKAAYAGEGKQAVWEYCSQGLVELRDALTDSPFGPLEENTVAPGYDARLLVAGVDKRKDEYLRLISENLEQGNNVLLLLPDAHTIGAHFHRFLTQALGKRVLWYTSSQPKMQAETFFRARSGAECLILGNKSAVLLPVRRNALIVVERPEEDEYRNEEAFHFNAVKLAMKSAEMQGIPILLGSVSPPLELVKLAQEGAVSLTREELFLQTNLSELRVESGKRGTSYRPNLFLVSIRRCKRMRPSPFTPHDGIMQRISTAWSVRSPSCVLTVKRRLPTIERGISLSAQTARKIYPTTRLALNAVGASFSSQQRGRNMLKSN